MDGGLDGKGWDKRTYLEGTCNDPREKDERKTGLSALVKILVLAM